MINPNQDASIRMQSNKQEARYSQFFFRVLAEYKKTEAKQKP